MTSQGFPAVGPARVSRELGIWLRIWAVARRHAYVLVRSPHRLFDVTVWPIVDTVLFGSLGVFFVRQGGPSSPGQGGCRESWRRGCGCGRWPAGTPMCCTAARTGCST